MYTHFLLASQWLVVCTHYKVYTPPNVAYTHLRCVGSLCIHIRVVYTQFPCCRCGAGFTYLHHLMTFDPDNPDDVAKNSQRGRWHTARRDSPPSQRPWVGCCRPWDSTSDRESAPSEGFCNEFNQKTCFWPKGFECKCRVELVIQADGSYKPVPAERLTSLVRSRQPCTCNAAKCMEAVIAEKEEVAGTETGSSDVERRRMLMLRLWQNIRNMRQLEPRYVEPALKAGIERHGLSDLQ